MSDADMSPAAPIEEGNHLQVYGLFGRKLQPSTEPIVANVSVPPDFLVGGQVSRLRTVHPLLTLDIFSHGVMLSRDWSDIVKDYILEASFLLLFFHCFCWFKVNYRRPCGITSLNHGAPWFQK